MKDKTQQESINDSFQKVIDNNIIVIEGVICEKLIGGFRVFGIPFKTLDEVRSEITKRQRIIEKSIK